MEARVFTKQEISLIRDNLFYDEGRLCWKEVKGRRKAGGIGTLNSRGYLTVNLSFLGRFCSTTVHRLVWIICYGENPHGQVDHINGDRTDNKVENLRVCSNSQNRMNSKPNTKLSHVYKGLSAKGNGYEVSVSVDGRRTYLGSSTNAREAALIYNHGAEKLFGNYARFNPVFEDVDEVLLSGQA